MKKGSKKVAKKVAQKTKKAAKKAAKKAVKKKIAGKVVSKKLPKKTAKKTTKKAAAKKKVIKKNMSEQTEMEIKDEAKVDSVENYQFEPIKGYPMLNWKGKRPFTSTQYYPAQLKENHGEPVDGWMNRIYWGDNLQVMSHMLKEFRGKVDLIYIDPPFASETDFRKTIKLRGTEVKNDENSLEEKQYSDIWANDEYLQFIYERLILMRELLSEKGSIYVHIDQRVSGYIRILCDEVFGKGQFRNWICWKSSPGHADQSFFNNMQNHILLYTKTSQATWNESHQAYDEEYLESHYGKTEPDGRRFEDADLTAYGLKGGGYEYEWKGIKKLWRCPESTMKKHEQKGQLYYTRNGVARYKRYLDQMPGMPTSDLWVDIPRLNSQAKEKVGYPTQKPEALLRRIIDASTNHGDLVFDCFMGSGTTQAVAYKMHRRFIGADINLGSVQTVTKRSIQILKDLAGERTKDITPGVAVYNVNHYDVFRNPIQAKELILEALEIQPLPNNSLYDGEKDGSMVKVMPVNRIATKADLTPLITGFDYKGFQKKQEASPSKPVESILLVCMGHEPDLAAQLKRECHGFELDVEVVDILRDKANLEFKRDSEAEITVEKDKLKIVAFYPMNLLQKLSLQKEKVEDWRELTESVMIDWNYDGGVFEPTTVDVPSKEEMVEGTYPVPEDAGTIRVKITDLLSESLEMDLTHG